MEGVFTAVLCCDIAKCLTSALLELGSSVSHRYDITDLEAGTAIYARVSGHTLMSYGYTALSDPEFETPSNVQPGAPAAVRLWASSDASITVHWDHPTVDGGTIYG